MTNEQNLFKVAPSPKKLRVSSDLEKCFICQKVSTKVEGLITPGRQGYTTFVYAANLRHSKGDDDIYERLQSFLDTTGKVIDQSHYGSIKWHKSCHCSFTSKKNISHLANDGIAPAVQSMSKEQETKEIRTKRSTSGKLDWTKCLFCQQLSYKKEKKLHKVITYEFGDPLKKKANETDDAQLKLHVGDFSKLIANDAVYHKGCHPNYMSQKQKLRKEPSAHDLTFQKLINEIEPKLFSGKAYDMSSVLQTFKKKLSENGDELSGEAYTSQKLKTKLLSHYQDRVTFLKQGPASAAELLVKSDIELKDVINVTFRYKEMLRKLVICYDSDKGELSINKSVTLYHAAAILHSYINDVVGIPYQPLDPRNISVESSENIVSDEIYNFFYWSICPKLPEDASPVNKKGDIRTSNTFLHRHVLSLGQDIICMRKNGKTRTPKHV